MPVRGKRRLLGRAPGRKDLQQARLSEAYKHRLEKSFTVFKSWGSCKKLDVEALSGSGEEMSCALIGFIQDLYEVGGALWVGTHAVLAAQTRWRNLRGQLRPAWDSIQSWKMLVPLTPRVPLPEVLLEAIARWAVFAALVLDPGHAPEWWCFAAVIRLGFYALLRPKEIWNLLRSDIRMPGPRSLLREPISVLTIREAKNRAYMGRLQIRTVRAPHASAWLAWLLDGAPSSAPVWPFPASAFRRRLDQALAFFGLEASRITPASLRAGGATAMLEAGDSITSIRFAGSWSSERVLSHYLQQAEAAAVLLDVSGPSADRIERASRGLCFAKWPPRPSYQQVIKEWTQGTRGASSRPPTQSSST